MKTVRKEIEEIFRTNQLGCNGHVMPTIEEWNKVGSHINELTAQVEELKCALKSLVWSSENNTGNEPSLSCYQRDIEEANELLTRIGKDNG